VWFVESAVLGLGLVRLQIWVRRGGIQGAPLAESCC